MAACRDIEPLITAVVDDEATDADREAVRGHLRECARCRQRAAGEASARRILRERARALHVEAPAGLRDRCLPPPRRAPFWGAVVRPAPAWATAAVVVALFAAAFYVGSRGSDALAAELVLDHVKCFALFERASGPGDPSAVADRMRTAYGWTLAVPASSAALGLRLVGGRRCFSTDGRVAHILYRDAGRPLSLFVLPGRSRSPQRLAVMGHEAVIWARGGNTYVVLARESRERVDRVAGYFRGVVN